MGVGAYVYLPLSSLQPLAPTAAVSSILSTYPSCPTNCVRRFSSLSFSLLLLPLLDLYRGFSLSSFITTSFPPSSSFQFYEENLEKRAPLPLLSFLPSYVSACTKRMFRTRSACARVNAAGFTLY